MTLAAQRPSRLAAFDGIYSLSMMSVIAAILTAAMVMQFAYGELPCPLCLLQRVALFGVCFSIVLDFGSAHSIRNIGAGLLFAAMLLIVSVRQTLLDIYPREGHAYIGSAIFGLHMPVWSVLIAVTLIVAFALKLIAFGNRGNDAAPVAPAFGRIARIAGAYVIILCAINLVAVVAQCGLGECHTAGYRLLQPAG